MQCTEVGINYDSFSCALSILVKTEDVEHEEHCVEQVELTIKSGVLVKVGRWSMSG